MLSYYGDVNLTKGAIYAADYVTTVSPTYAKELQYSFYAHGLEPVPDVPIIACISRLVSHKGYDLITAAFPKMMEHNVQFVILGTGDWGIEAFFRNAAKRYPGRVSANLLYSAKLSSQIYAGADLLLMPSISEPCGLSQMIAMRYGTVPIVRLTGGLKDSVPSYNPTTGEGLGFTFGNITAGDMLSAVDRALALYETDQPKWKQLMKKGMQVDLSWDKSASAYEEIYRKLCHCDGES